MPASVASNAGADTSPDTADIARACFSSGPDASGSGRGTARGATALIGAAGQGKTSTDTEGK